MELNPAEQPHRRRNLLTGEFVLVSPQRSRRPWQGEREAAPVERLPQYDPGCYLCPGNERAGGLRNPAYTQTFVFRNDFPALLPGERAAPAAGEALLQLAPVRGDCQVLCFSPRHDVTLAQMALPELRRVIDVQAQLLDELCQRWRHVQFFENRGNAMGASSPHPHGQIWASDALPTIVAREDEQQRAYARQPVGRPLLLDYVETELRSGERIVCQNEHWLALVPFWAVWPFELMLLPRRHVGQLQDLRDGERDALAAILHQVLRRYDGLFEAPCPAAHDGSPVPLRRGSPYSMGWHGAPAGAEAHWQLHAHFLPPMLRSATVRKFMVGYELLAEPQRDLTPEQAAERLREVAVE